MEMQLTTDAQQAEDYHRIEQAILGLGICPG